MKKIFVTFGSKRFEQSRKRICHEARATKWFDSYHSYTPGHLGLAFNQAHRKFIRKNRKGFGCYIWKSYVIERTLAAADIGDIVFWADAGCSFDLQYVHMMDECLDKLRQSPCGVLGFLTSFPEMHYTTSDLADYLGVLDNESIMQSLQVRTGYMFFEKTTRSQKFVAEWARTAQIHKFSRGGHKGRVRPNHVEFIAHRHDQSIFSLLCKKYGATVYCEPLPFFICPTRIRK